tara:strand:+ start:6247 stop:7440 length:1194 start_codon:yes stop_codon:yes gene_type:complete
MKIENNYIKNLKKEDISFYGYPVKYTLKDYDGVLNKIKDKAKRAKEVLSIYTFGKIGIPGISDIDLIFVLKENSKLPKFLKNYYVDKQSKYILLHPFFIIPEKIMKNIKYIYPNSDFVNIYGKKIDIYNPSRTELKKIKTYLTADVILRHFPVDHLYTLLSKNIDVRMALVRLNAFRHSFSIFRDITGKEKQSWRNLSKKISYLREKCFTMKKIRLQKKLLDVLKESIYISTDFIREFDAAIYKNKLRNKNVIFKGTKNRISLIDSWNGHKAIDQMLNHFIRYRNFYSILPINLLNQLCAYSSLSGRLSRYIRKRLSVKCHKKNIEPTLRKRIQILNDQVEYTNELKHSHYPCFFPLGYKTEKGLKNKLILLFVIVTSNSIFRSILFYLRGITRRKN